MISLPKIIPAKNQCKATSEPHVRCGNVWDVQDIDFCVNFDRHFPPLGNQLLCIVRWHYYNITIQFIRFIITIKISITSLTERISSLTLIYTHIASSNLTPKEHSCHCCK